MLKLPEQARSSVTAVLGLGASNNSEAVSRRVVWILNITASTPCRCSPEILLFAETDGCGPLLVNTLQNISIDRVWWLLPADQAE